MNRIGFFILSIVQIHVNCCFMSFYTFDSLVRRCCIATPPFAYSISSVSRRTRSCTPKGPMGFLCRARCEPAHCFVSISRVTVWLAPLRYFYKNLGARFSANARSPSLDASVLQAVAIMAAPLNSCENKDSPIISFSNRLLN